MKSRGESVGQKVKHGVQIRMETIVKEREGLKQGRREEEGKGKSRSSGK